MQIESTCKTIHRSHAAINADVLRFVARAALRPFGESEPPMPVWLQAVAGFFVSTSA